MVDGVDRESRALQSQEVDERAARRTLRDQIARLERELAAALIAAYPRLPAGRAGVRRLRPAPARRSASSSASATTSPAASPTCASRPPARASARPPSAC